jgi:glycosyltransferase involved in cell wall biosynthesis
MHAKPKLLFYCLEVGRAGSRGGVGVSAERICHHLRELFEVHVLSGTDDIPPLGQASIEESGLHLHHLGGHPDRALWRKGLLDFATRLHNVHAFEKLVAFYCNGDASAIRLLAQVSRLPLYSFFRGNDLHIETLGSDAFLIQELALASTLCICPSREMERELLLFAPTANAVCIPNGVDTDLFAHEPQETDESARRAILGLFGDIKHKKGLAPLLEAIDFERFELKIVGTLRADMQKLLHGFLSLNHHLQSSIEVVPRTENISELIAHYRSCDAVVIPSLYDGMPNVLLEAMALGKICIGSATGGMCDLIASEVNGLLFSPGCVQSLKTALSTFSGLTLSTRAEIENRARRAVVESFTIAHEAERLARAFQALENTERA